MSAQDAASSNPKNNQTAQSVNQVTPANDQGYDLTVALVSKDNINLEFFASKVEIYGAKALRFSSISDLQKNLGGKRLSGIIVDLRATLGTTSEEKHFLNELDKSFPVMRLNRRGLDEDDLTAVTGLMHMKGLSLFSEYLDHISKNFKPRGMRQHPRKFLHLNILYATDEDLAENKWFRATSVDISEGGIYLHTCRDLSIGEKLNLKIKELDVPPSIFVGIVKWSIHWGNVSYYRLPGIGIEFSNLTDEQKARIRRLVFDGPIANSR